MNRRRLTRQVVMLLALAVAILSGLTRCGQREPDLDLALTDNERAQFASPLSHAAWNKPGSWPQFAHDPLHSGQSQVDLVSADLQLRWKFRPTEHVWQYLRGYATWSSPVVAEVGERTLVIAGHYDKVVYAVDGQTGQGVWEFRPGAPVFASPAMARIAGKPMVFVAALNRSIYGLDAASGQQIWNFETLPWTFTQSESFMSSPTLVRDAGRTLLVIGAFNSDRSAARNVQSGELIVLDAADGTLLWRRHLASVRLTSPAVAQMDGRLVVFICAHHGGVWAVSLADGTKLWHGYLNEESRSSVSVAAAGDVGRVLVGSRFHSLFGLNWRTGSKKWRRQVGYWIDATPAWFDLPAGTTTVIGSYDRSFHAFKVTDGQPRWSHTTGNYAYSSAASARLGDRRVVATMSWDEYVYLLDAADGTVLFRARSGPLLWSHAFQGDSLWASPVIARLGDRPGLLVAAFDGVLYAYGPRGGQDGRGLSVER